MAPVNQDLAKALQLHRSAKYAAAIEVYRKVLQANPQNIDAAHYIGLAYLQSGDTIRAADALEAAAEQFPSNTDILTNAATVAFQAKRFSHSLQLARRLLDADPLSADAHNTIGNVFFAQEKFKEALDSYSLAIKLTPLHPTYIYNRGRANFSLGRMNEAVEDFQAAITINPSFVEALHNLALTYRAKRDYQIALQYLQRAIQYSGKPQDLLVTLADLLVDLERTEEAIKVIDQALDAGETVELLVSKSKALQCSHRSLDALVSDTRAIELDPNYAPAWNSMGSSLSDLGRLDEALNCFTKATAIDPGYAWAWSNKGNALNNLHRYQEALACFRSALGLNPYLESAHMNLGMALLMLCQFEPGWHEYTWRRFTSSPGQKNLVTTRSEWGGCDSKTVRLFVWAEQGVGDNVLYSAMLKDLERFSNPVIVSADERLIPTFKRSFPKIQFVSRSQPLSEGLYDQHIPIGDLGKWFRNELDQFNPTRQSYLISDPVKTSKWEQIFNNTRSLKVGLSWRSVNKTFGHHKSMALSELESLLAIKGADFINLQYDSTTEELHALPGQIREKFVHLDNLDTRNDLDGLLSLIQACDVVVTVSNTTAHLSGAIGKKTLLMLPYSQGKLWYWQPHPQNPGSLWYESVQLFEQERHNNWSTVLNHVKTTLDQLINNTNH